MVDARGNPKKRFDVHKIKDKCDYHRCIFHALIYPYFLSMPRRAGMNVTNKDGASVPAENGNRYNKVRKTMDPGKKKNYLEVKPCVLWVYA